MAAKTRDERERDEGEKKKSTFGRFFYWVRSVHHAKTPGVTSKKDTGRRRREEEGRMANGYRSWWEEGSLRGRKDNNNQKMVQDTNSQLREEAPILVG